MKISSSGSYLKKDVLFHLFIYSLSQNINWAWEGKMRSIRSTTELMKKACVNQGISSEDQEEGMGLKQEVMTTKSPFYLGRERRKGQSLIWIRFQTW